MAQGKEMGLSASLRSQKFGYTGALHTACHDFGSHFMGDDHLIIKLLQDIQTAAGHSQSDQWGGVCDEFAR
jgi:hypothetical protein